MSLHVVPTNDLRKHNTDTDICACKPEYEMSNGELLVIHNSWDRREWDEAMKQIGPEGGERGEA